MIQVNQMLSRTQIVLLGKRQAEEESLALWENVDFLLYVTMLGGKSCPGVGHWTFLVQLCRKLTMK